MGCPNQRWLKTVRNMKIYCGYLADTTKAWVEKTKFGVTAKVFYDTVNLPITDEFDYSLKSPKSMPKWRRTWKLLYVHPQASESAKEYDRRE